MTGNLAGGVVEWIYIHRPPPSINKRWKFMPYILADGTLSLVGYQAGSCHLSYLRMKKANK
jgi:hypothetical protein